MIEALDYGFYSINPDYLFYLNNIDKDIYKYYSDKKKIHILALLDIKKMIPVPDGEFERIEFNEIDDLRYKSLLQKEYAFCLKIKDKLFKKVNKIYTKQKNEGKVKRTYCDFIKLEKAMLKWK